MDTRTPQSKAAEMEVAMHHLRAYDRTHDRPGRQLVNLERVGRNDPCLCGSGKKWKRCCLTK